MNNNPMNGFGMNTNDYGNNGGLYPQADNSASFGNVPMSTGNPTLDLLNQSNGIVPSASNVPPVSTGNPTLDLLNQSQVQNGPDSSYGFVPSMNDETNSSMDMNAFNSPQPMPAFGLDNNVGTTNGMMPDYGMNMNQPMPQQPLDYASKMPQPVPMDPQYQQPMGQQPMDYSVQMGQMVQQPLTSMEMAPSSEPMPVVENTNPYGFVPMMPTPEPEPTPAATTSAGEFNFSFIPLREENAPAPQPPMEVQPVPMDNSMLGQMSMEQSAMPPMGMPGMEMQPQPAPMEQYNGQIMPQPTPMPVFGLDNNMGTTNGMMPDYGMNMNQPIPQPVSMEPQYQQQPMAPMGMPGIEMQPQLVPMEQYNGQMGQPMYPEQPMMPQPMGQMPMGYPQPMPQQPVQDPNAIYPGIPDDVGNFPQ